MDVDTFWQLIEESHRQTDDYQQQGVILSKMLESLDTDAILDFEDHMADRMRELYRWDLWAVADIMNGGASDDGFDYFRQWIVAQGRAFYDTVLQAPERAAEAVPVGTEDDHWRRECESMLPAARWAYENKTRQEIPPSEKPLTMVGEEPYGEFLDDDEQERRYPQLWARFITSRSP